jgi:hypothetical protein
MSATMVTHIVVFRFHDPSVAGEARDRLLSMAGKIPGMLGIEAGVDFTRSDRSYHLGLVTRHESRDALLVYQTHPVHVDVASFVKARSAASASVDFDENS